MSRLTSIYPSLGGLSIPCGSKSTPTNTHLGMTGTAPPDSVIQTRHNAHHPSAQPS